MFTGGYDGKPREKPDEKQEIKEKEGSQHGWGEEPAQPCMHRWPPMVLLGEEEKNV